MPSLPPSHLPDSERLRDLSPSEVKVERGGKVRGQSVTKTIVMYQPPNNQPKLFDRSVKVLDGPRHARRPSSVAKKKGKRNITEVEWADEFDEPEEGWSDEDLMPAETCKEDCYWAAGPIPRGLPPFRGPPPGPTDATMNGRTTPQQ
eukprot:scaffold132158_cov27-Tisochrysis_lutea.AAC.1